MRQTDRYVSQGGQIRQSDVGLGGFGLALHVAFAQPRGHASTRVPTEQSMPRNDGLATPRLAWRVTGPVRAVQRIFERWDVPLSVVASLLDYRNEAELVELYEGAKPLVGRDREDRVRQVLRIYDAIYQLYEDPGVEREWLRSGVPELDGKSPLAYMVERGFEGVIAVRDYAFYLSGR